MQQHLGNFFKDLIVNQGFMIKDFAMAYGTTPTHMSEILSKEDFNTSIIRKFEVLLKNNFRLINDTRLIGSGNENEENYASSVIRGKSIGRPILLGKNETNSQALLEVKEAEIRGLKQLLDSKDEIIKSKDQFINQLITPKI